MMISVRSSQRFDPFDRFDSLLHVTRGDVTMRHVNCGGTIDVTPRAFKRSLFGGYTATGHVQHHLRCDRCGASEGPYEHSRLARSLAQFLTGPDWETAPAQHLDETVQFVPPEWPPHRRRSPDRRRPDSRYSVDRSMEGRRRIDHDRRMDPGQLDR